MPPVGSVKFHVPIEVEGPTGATAATRYAGATASGAPASGSFLKGDFVIDQAGKVWVCTAAGSPGTWADVGGSGGSVTFGTPALTFDTSNAAGSTDEVIRRDASLAIFDATNPTTQAFGDSAAVGTAAFAARRDHKHAMPATPVTSFAKSGGSALTGAVTISEGSGITLTPSGNDIAIAAAGGSGIGGSELIYRYTVTGSDKASIDTGADTADAGSNDWTNGDLLEIWMLLQGDNAATVDVAVDLTFNNDANANYDNQALSAVNTSVAGAGAVAQSSWAFNTKGQGGSTSYPSVHRITIPGYADTTFFKVGESETGRIDTTAANQRADIRALGYRSTSAITRAKIAARSTQKLKVGSQLLIYKRLAS